MIATEAQQAAVEDVGRQILALAARGVVTGAEPGTAAYAQNLGEALMAAALLAVPPEAAPAFIRGLGITLGSFSGQLSPEQAPKFLDTLSRAIAAGRQGWVAATKPAGRA